MGTKPIEDCYLKKVNQNQEPGEELKKGVHHGI